jgi:hypothetical protein
VQKKSNNAKRNRTRAKLTEHAQDENEQTQKENENTQKET